MCQSSSIIYTHTHTRTHTYTFEPYANCNLYIICLKAIIATFTTHAHKRKNTHTCPAPPVHTSLTILHLVPINFQTPQMTCAATAASYEELCTKLRKISHLEGAMGLMGWDEQTMMPIGAEE